MRCDINSLFAENTISEKIRQKLPLLFHIAEEESKRNNKIGMEVGIARERVIISMLMHFLGESHVSTEIPTTEAEKDVLVDGLPFSIKTISSPHALSYDGVKAS